MPLDPVLAGGIRPTVEPTNPLQTVASIMALKGQMSDIALRNQQIEQSKQQQQLIQAEQTQKNRDLADVNNYTALIKDPGVQARFNATGDISDFQKAGIQPKFTDALVKSRLDRLQGAMTLNKDELANRAEATSQLAKLAVNLSAPGADGTPADLATLNSRYGSSRDSISSLMKMAGYTGDLPGTLSSPEQFQQVLAQLHGDTALYSTALANKETQTKAAALEAEANKANADALQAKAQADHLAATLPKDEADAQIAKLNADFAKAHGGLTPEQAESARHNKAQENVSAGELGLKQKTFDATLGSGLDANGQPMAPEAMKQAALQDPTAVAIAHYQLAPPPAQTRGGVPSPILRKVLAINPQYDATTYPARAETARGFSPSGAQGQAITAADTALAHLNTLSAAGAAMNNGDVQLMNRVANAIGAQVGATPKATYDTILNMVGPEISKAVIGAAGGEGERAGTASNFDSKLSNSQRESNIAAAVGLLGARFDKASHAYESQMGVPLPRTLSPESQAIRAKYSTPSGGATSHKVGDVVAVGGKHVKITAIHNDGTFDGDEVK